MAGEIQVSGPGTGKTLYATIRNRIGQIWNVTGGAFETYATANYADYDVSLVEQGSASNFYVGNFPSTITAGVYSVTAKQQLGGSVAETDPTVAAGDIQWNGSATVPLSDAATSGQVGQALPIRIFRGQMVQNFPLYFKSSVDHVTPFTSGVVSGQISRDGGVFGALQSGTVTEVGLGFYKVNLTSGDLLANTASLVFTGAGVSGGVVRSSRLWRYFATDERPMIFDFTYFGAFLGLVVYPEWAFSDLGRAEPIIETVFVKGTTAGNTFSVGGNIDD